MFGVGSPQPGAVLTGRVDSVLIAQHLPELRADLVAALAGLDVDNCTPHMHMGVRNASTQVLRREKRQTHKHAHSQAATHFRACSELLMGGGEVANSTLPARPGDVSTRQLKILNEL